MIKTSAVKLASGAALLAALALGGCMGSGGDQARLARASAPACGNSSFPIYFQSGSDQLTPESADVISHAAETVKGCALGPLDVVGLAGSLEGPPEQAIALAKRRSVTVADALKTAGLPAPRFDLDAVGNEGAKTKVGKRVPLRRRAEVLIHAGAPPKTAAR